MNSHLLEEATLLLQPVLVGRLSVMRMAGHSAAARVNNSRAASWDKGGLIASQLCKQTAIQDPQAFECGLKSCASVFT